MNSEFTIIEDCSPYYIRFTHSNIDDIIKLASDAMAEYTFSEKWTVQNLDHAVVKKIKNLCPLFDVFDLSVHRLSMFVSQPGLYYRAHKDGPNHRFSINYTVKILDNKCVTSWYSDEDLQKYTIDYLGGRSRECVDFDKSAHTPLKSMVAVPGECILFNTDIFHDWDNQASKNERMVLTLRLKDYSQPNSSFQDARDTLLKLADKSE